MKYFELDEEEKQILEDYDKGEFVPVKNQAAEKKKAMESARYTLSKTRNINIRVSEKTLLKLKAKAIEEGLPYQTLISSVLHKFANK